MSPRPAAFALFAPSPERRRSLSWLAVAGFGVALSLGPSFGLFSILYEVFPPYRALRVPSRAGILFLLAVSMLAALGLRRVRRRGIRIALVALAASECFSGPLPLRMEPPVLPSIYRHLDGLEGEGALLELPLPPPERFQDNAVYVFRSSFHRRALVNGYSGEWSNAHVRFLEQTATFPDDSALQALRDAGVTYVLVHEQYFGSERYELAEEELRRSPLVEEAGRFGDEGVEVAVYRLRP